ncbi:MAG: VPLPA-CTERM sorting domain-containing protein [Pseudomonadota bacterium]
MTMRFLTLVPALVAFSATGADAVPVYLNIDNITVEVGPGTSDGTFNNTFDGGLTIDKVIDAPSADATETHTQTTHIWFTADQAGGGLELLFDLQTEYDITTLHFWNYNGESYDVDNIDFTFFDGDSAEVGALSVEPALGSTPIAAEDIALAAPLNVRYVTAFLTGSNRQVDFQNIGFTAEASSPQPDRGVVPIPAAAPMLAGALGALVLAARRRRTG